LALLNDYTFSDDPEHADDNRWIHRPKQPWDVVATLDDNPESQAAVTFDAITRLAKVRASIPSLHASVSTHVITAPDSAIVLFVRHSAAGEYVGVFNVADRSAWLDAGVLEQNGITSPLDVISGERPVRHGPGFELRPYEAWWLVNRPR
jgi:amylosucrase